VTAAVKKLPEPEPVEDEVNPEDDFDEDQAIKDYLAEVDQFSWKFRVGGEVYEANLNLEGVYMLRWFSSSPSVRMQMIPDMIKVSLGDEQYARLLSSGIPWVKMDSVATRLIEKVQGPLPGKARLSRSTGSSRTGGSSRSSGKRSKRTS